MYTIINRKYKATVGNRGKERDFNTDCLCTDLITDFCFFNPMNWRIAALKE